MAKHFQPRHIAEFLAASSFFFRQSEISFCAASSKALHAPVVPFVGEGAAQSVTVTVLFARSDSIYKRLPGCDVWDIDRDARNYSGDLPVIAHPPCRAWAGLRHMAKPRPDEKELALFAVDQVRRCGGVLEHPARSTLWPVAGLPAPGKRDSFGGWTLPVYQSDFGHKAQKATLLYICGIEPAELPSVQLRLGEASHVIGSSGLRMDGIRSVRRPEVPRRDREATPVDFAKWLVELALLCRKLDIDQVFEMVQRSGFVVIPGLCLTGETFHVN